MKIQLLPLTLLVLAATGVVIFSAAFHSPSPSGAFAAAPPAPRQEPNKGGAVDLSTQDPAEALKRFTPAEGYEISLFASEKDFPIADPVAINFDARGRLWVSTTPSYPHYTPGVQPDDKLVILEDADGDGRADKHKVFADKLYLPIGFELGSGGAYVSQQPNLMFLKDTNGDDIADARETILHGFGTEDSHHAAHAFTWDPGGALYFGEGTFHHSQVETPHGPVRLADAGFFRFEPRTHKLDVFVSYGFANPWGHIFDRWGQNFIADASGGSNYFALPMTGHVDYPRKHPAMQEFTLTKVRPTCGCVLVSSRQFPDSAQGNFLLNNCIGFQGIKQYQVVEKDSGFEAKEIEPLLFSSDPNFRPVDIEFGPDGALYIADWFNPLLGHMQYSLRDPGRDHSHGRIWRIAYKGRPLVEKAKIAGQPVPDLLDQLKTYEDATRYRVRRELRERSSDEVVAALEQWIAGLDAADPEHQHHLLEALWVYQGAGVVEPELLNRLLRSPDYRARAAATRVLRYWRERVPNPLDLLQTQVNDEHPRVRLEAVIALSHFRSQPAAEIALEAIKHPLDYYLEYGLKETIATLEPYWKPTIAAGKPFSPNNPTGADYVLVSGMSTAELVKLPRSVAVCMALLSRPGVPAQDRAAALRDLAAANKSTEMNELLAAIWRIDGGGGNSEHTLADLAQILTSRPATELAAARDGIDKLARLGHRLARRMAYVALMTADGSPDRVWEAAQTPQALQSVVEALPRAPVGVRTAAYARVAALAQPPLSGQAVHPSLAQAAQDLGRAAMLAMAATPGRETETFKTLADFIKQGDERESAVAALRRLPKTTWPADEIQPLLDGILGFVATTPIDERTSDSVVQSIQLGGELAARLPPEAALQARKQLRELGVPVIVIRPVPHQMVFDRTKFFVEAGKPVEIILENPDIMPHNLLITAPGAVAEIGGLAEQMASSPDAFAQHFVPKSPKVLHATKLLGPQETQRLQFTAPQQPGAYPYVCTFPGHWRTMSGMMHVVDDLNSVPEQDLAPEALEPVEARPFVQNWTMADLAADLDDAGAGRSFEQGQTLFAAVSCNACHKVGETGGLIGPDLTDVAQRFKRPDLLREILEPSHVINEKFQTQMIQTADGELVSGVIVAQDEESIQLMANPLEKCEPRVIALDDIEQQKASEVSLMPEGLLVTLSKEEIWDLLAYIETGGDSNAAAFKKSRLASAKP